jgi:hypothetical protein
MDYTKIPDGASVFARQVCEEKAALYARYKALQEELDCATDRYEHFLAECTALHAEKERLREALAVLIAYIDNRKGKVRACAPALLRARAALEGGE